MSSEYAGADVLVTGGLGFIGSNLVHRLVESGSDVTVLDSVDDEYGGNWFNVAKVEDSIDVAIGDIRDEGTIIDLIDGKDFIFHLAAQLSRPISISDPQFDVTVNCTGSLNVLQGARESSTNPIVVFTSSQAVFGSPSELPLTEESPDDPIDIYGANKSAAENYFNIYQQVHGVSTRSVRLTNVYGPRAQLDNPKYGVINKFVRLAFQGETLTVYEPGTMRRDPVFVGDVIDGLLLAGTEGDAGEDYIIGSGKSFTIKALASTIVDAVGQGSVELTEWPEDWDSIRVGDIEVDNTKARRELGWEPNVSLKEGMKRTADYFDGNLNEYF